MVLCIVCYHSVNEDAIICGNCKCNFHTKCVGVEVIEDNWLCETCTRIPVSCNSNANEVVSHTASNEVVSHTASNEDLTADNVNNISSKTTRSGRLRRRLDLRRLEEEKKLTEARNREAISMQKKLDDEFLAKKYAMMEEEDNSDGSDEYEEYCDGDDGAAGEKVDLNAPGSSSHFSENNVFISAPKYQQSSASVTNIGNSVFLRSMNESVTISSAQHPIASTSTYQRPNSNAISGDIGEMNPTVSTVSWNSSHPTATLSQNCSSIPYLSSSYPSQPFANMTGPNAQLHRVGYQQLLQPPMTFGIPAPSYSQASVPIPTFGSNVPNVYVQPQTFYNQVPPVSQASAGPSQQPFVPNGACQAPPIPQAYAGPAGQPYAPNFYNQVPPLAYPANNVQQPLSRNQYGARTILPKELLTFSGLPEEWPMFISNFERTTRTCGFSDDENLVRLQKCLKGKALEAVRCRLLLPECVGEVIETLRLLYGRPELILNSLLAKVRAEPAPKPERLDTLINYALSVQNLCGTITASGLIAHQSNPMLLQELTDKLPTSIKLNWAIYRQGLPAVDLIIFSRWLFNVAQAASTVTLPAATTSLPESKTESRSSAQKAKGFLHTHAENKSTESCTGEALLSKLKAISELNQRWKYVKENKLCSRCLGKHHYLRCKSTAICGVNGCIFKHHQLLHNDKKDTTPEPCHSHDRKSSPSVLFRIVPVMLHGKSKAIQTFAFLDDGSSVTLLEEDIANELELNGTPDELCLQWTSNVSRVEHNSRRVSLDISSQVKGSHKYHLNNVRTVGKLNLPIQSFTAEQKIKYDHLRDVPIEVYRDATPRIMIGLEHWRLGIATEIKEGRDNEPVAARTRLGWTIHGRCCHHHAQSFSNSNFHHSFHICACNTNEELHQLVKDFFAVDNFGVNGSSRRLESPDDKRAREILEATTIHTGERYETSLLWRYDDVKLPDSLPMARRRLLCLEKNMARNPQLALTLKTQMREYVEKSYARKLTKDELATRHTRIWYLPVFTVTNANKPGKIRMVWDAAAKVDGVSLNYMLLKGPDQLTSLPSVLFGFRQRPVAICGDIKEMYHQVNVCEADQHAQRFLWRDGDSQREPDHYVMKVMTFGATCSPSAAQFVKNTNALKFAEKYPRAVTCIIQQHYVDDLLDSVDTEAEAIQLAKDVRMIHQKAGFEIRNWHSNSANVLTELHTTSLPSKNLDIKPELTTEKVLGMWWSTQSDTFSYSVSYKKINDDILNGKRRPTKREVLRTLMSVFDPLGFLASFLVLLKILLQRIWRSNIEWDEEIGDELYDDWLLWTKLLPAVAKIEIPRSYLNGTVLTDSHSVQLHIFVDASENAFAAVAYFRFTNGDDIDCSIVAAKTKVAPQSPISIPRLELQAATLGARLASTIRSSHTMRIDSQHFWSDSRTVLSWLRTNPRNYRQFVAFRLVEIAESTKVSEWRWVPTALNVADEATKWQKFPDLSSNSRWLNGPPFLRLPEEEWPKQPTIGSISDSIDDVRVVLSHSASDPPITVNIEYFGSWQRMLRAQARVYRTAAIWIAAVRNSPKPLEPITSLELEQAKQRLLHRAQYDGFKHEYFALKYNRDNPEHHQAIDNSSILYTYSPYLDADGLIRSKGRIDAAPNVETEDVKRPSILPRDHPITKLLVDDYHRQFNHQNHETVLNEIRQHHMVPRLRQVIKSVRTKCQACKNSRSIPIPPQMAELPVSRLASFTRPFTYIGIDYFGPMLVVVGRRVEKRWGVLITCLTIRAVHIEIAYSLTTDSCIMSIQNFIARRGIPAVIHCDNGTNLHGAKNELERALQEVNFDLMQEKFESADTTWKFNPPAAPHMGGSWERLVGSVKKSLDAISPNRKPSDEVLRNLLMEVERIINTRPLTHVSLEKEDEEALTPNHFLVGSSSGARPLGIFSDTDLILRKSWRIAQQLANHFWRRWVREYLPTLTRRCKWFKDVKPIEVGDIVIVTDEREPRNCWPKGRIVEVTKAKDGKVRRALVQTKKGIMNRPAVKIAVLDVQG